MDEVLTLKFLGGSGKLNFRKLNFQLEVVY